MLSRVISLMRWLGSWEDISAPENQKEEVMAMDRRNFLIASTCLTAASTALGAELEAQAQGRVQEKVEEKKSKAELDKQYEVCKVRGHVAAPGISQQFTPPNVPPPMNPNPAPQGYMAESETPWSTCYYCGRQWRYVTKIEEKVA